MVVGVVVVVTIDGVVSSFSDSSWAVVVGVVVDVVVGVVTSTVVEPVVVLV